MLKNPVPILCGEGLNRIPSTPVEVNEEHLPTTQALTKLWSSHSLSVHTPTPLMLAQADIKQLQYQNYFY